jgi:hypothetical protein
MAAGTLVDDYDLRLWRRPNPALVASLRLASAPRPARRRRRARRHNLTLEAASNGADRSAVGGPRARRQQLSLASHGQRSIRQLRRWRRRTWLLPLPYGVVVDDGDSLRGKGTSG